MIYNKIYLLVIVLMFLSRNLLSQEVDKNRDRIELLLLDCIKYSYKEEGIAIDSLMNVYEKYLIENNFIEDNSGLSYKKNYQKIIENNNITSEISPQIFKKVSKVYPNKYYSYDCVSNKLDTTLLDFFLKTKAYILSQKIKDDPDKSLIKTTRNILSILDEKDFERPYFRMLNLLTIAWTSFPDDIFQIEVGKKEK